MQSIFSYGFTGLVGAAFSLPAVSLVLALVLALGIITFTKTKDADPRLAKLPDDAAIAFNARYTRERRTLAVSALAVIVAFMAENVVRGYVVNMADVVSWWRFALPVFVALAGVTALLMMIGVGAARIPARPAGLGIRRTWMSFGPRAGIVGALVVALALCVTTITAGLASSPDDQGRYVYLEIPVPNESIDPVRTWFYGWAYGIPVLMCLFALSLATVVTLHRSAVRPFLSAESAGVEQAARSEVAAGAVRVAVGGLLLALAGAWRFIAGAGSTSELTIHGDTSQQGTYEVAWRFAEFAAIGGWFAPALEIGGFVLLLLVAFQIRRGSVGSESRVSSLRSPVSGVAS
ncbi:hypothetical protein [Microbacterium shaanxiense]